VSLSSLKALTVIVFPKKFYSFYLVVVLNEEFKDSWLLVLGIFCQNCNFLLFAERRCDRAPDGEQGQVHGLHHRPGQDRSDRCPHQLPSEGRGEKNILKLKLCTLNRVF
jgi:hypothetical protein